jgi:hypothetical protein
MRTRAHLTTQSSRGKRVEWTRSTGARVALTNTETLGKELGYVVIVVGDYIVDC